MPDHRELKYEIQLNRVQKIALSGIGRALTFIKFAETGVYNREKVNNLPQKEQKIFTDNSMPPIQEPDFQKWKDEFVAWNLNNSLNEIVESFFVFLEIICWVLEVTGNRREFSVEDKLGDAIKNWQNEVRNGLRNKNKLQVLTQKGITLTEDCKKIIESFWSIRNLLSHNLGIADVSPKLNIDSEKITLKWYRSECFVKLRSGKEIPITSDPLPEPGTLCLRQKQLQTKEITIGTRISFDMDEVQQIARTFQTIVHEVSSKTKTCLEGREV